MGADSLADWLALEVFMGQLAEERARLLRATPTDADALPGFAAFAAEAGLRESPVEVRARVRRRLLALKAAWQERLSTRELYYALLPVTVLTDEQLRSASGEQLARWEPLQSELYQFDDGGEAFYLVLDTLLAKEETAPFVLEVFLFCLDAGFRGLYGDDTERRERIRARLLTRLAPKTPAAREPEPAPLEPVRPLSTPWHYYALAGGLTLGLWLSLVGASYLL